MKVFYPVRYEDVAASPPHAPNTAYRVSFGIEHWGPGEAAHVYKIQMVYSGAVSGRRSPSYPEDSDDLQRVLVALDRVRKGGGAIGRGLIQPVGPDKGFSHRQAKDLSAEG